jgi:hypothetical protein
MCEDLAVGTSLRFGYFKVKKLRPLRIETHLTHLRVSFTHLAFRAVFQKHAHYHINLCQETAIGNTRRLGKKNPKFGQH